MMPDMGFEHPALEYQATASKETNPQQSCQVSKIFDSIFITPLVGATGRLPLRVTPKQ